MLEKISTNYEGTFTRQFLRGFNKISEMASETRDIVHWLVTPLATGKPIFDLAQS